MQEAAATMFLGSRAGLNISANAAGYQGTLPEQFVMAGHSAGGGFATAVAGDYIADRRAGPNRTTNLGVVMFDESLPAQRISPNQSPASTLPQHSTTPWPRRPGRGTRSAPPQTNWSNFAGTVRRGRTGRRFPCRLDARCQPAARLRTSTGDRVLPRGNTAAAYTLSWDGSTISTSDRDRPIRHTASTVPPVIRSFWGSPLELCCRCSGIQLYCNIGGIQRGSVGLRGYGAPGEPV